MLDTSITDHNVLPEHVRRYPSYEYLKVHQEYWRHAVDVAHQLIATHKELYGHDIYGHDQFIAHFKATLKKNDLCPDAQLLGPFTLNSSLSSEEKRVDPQWLAYREACKALTAGPRGTAMVFKICTPDREHWEANAHVGGGTVSNCSTMQRGKAAATLAKIWDNIMEHEAYLARNQAEQERLILANYARIQKLKLSPGMRIQNYQIMHEGKRRKMRFVVSAIHENGQVHLIDGKLRGCSEVFTTTIDAVLLTLNNTDPVAAKSEPKVTPHPFSLGLF